MIENKNNLRLRRFEKVFAYKKEKKMCYFGSGTFKKLCVVIFGMLGSLKSVFCLCCCLGTGLFLREGVSFVGF